MFSMELYISSLIIKNDENLRVQFNRLITMLGGVIGGGGRGALGEEGVRRVQDMGDETLITGRGISTTVKSGTEI